MYISLTAIAVAVHRQRHRQRQETDRDTDKDTNVKVGIVEELGGRLRRQHLDSHDVLSEIQQVIVRYSKCEKLGMGAVAVRVGVLTD